MIYLKIYKNYSHKINKINFMENFTKILFRVFKGVFLKKTILVEGAVRKNRLREKKCFERKKKYLKPIRADKKKLCMFHKFCQLC